MGEECRNLSYFTNLIRSQSINESLTFLTFLPLSQIKSFLTQSTDQYHLITFDDMNTSNTF